MELVVRWLDQDGNERTKVYKKEPDARKAKDWLLSNGVKNVDIAVRLIRR